MVRSDCGLATDCCMCCCLCVLVSVWVCQGCGWVVVCGGMVGWGCGGLEMGGVLVESLTGYYRQGLSPNWPG